MLIYLFRHGITIDREHPECPPDPERFLTKKGVARTRAAARGMAALGVHPQVILTSPWLRARQTAEIAANELGVPEDRIHDSFSLLHDADPAELVHDLAQLSKRAVLCSGHAPHLDLLIAHMIGVDRPITKLKKAGLAVLETAPDEPGRAALVALYPPRALRTLAKAA